MRTPRKFTHKIYYLKIQKKIKKKKKEYCPLLERPTGPLKVTAKLKTEFYMLRPFVIYNARKEREKDLNISLKIVWSYPELLQIFFYPNPTLKK